MVTRSKHSLLNESVIINSCVFTNNKTPNFVQYKHESCQSLDEIRDSRKYAFLPGSKRQGNWNGVPMAIMTKDFSRTCAFCQSINKQTKLWNCNEIVNEVSRIWCFNIWLCLKIRLNHAVIFCQFFLVTVKYEAHVMTYVCLFLSSILGFLSIRYIIVYFLFFLYFPIR